MDFQCFEFPARGASIPPSLLSASHSNKLGNREDHIAKDTVQLQVQTESSTSPILVKLGSILNALPLILLGRAGKSIVYDLTVNLPLGDFKTASYTFGDINHGLGLGLGDDQNGERRDGGKSTFVP